MNKLYFILLLLMDYIIPIRMFFNSIDYYNFHSKYLCSLYKFTSINNIRVTKLSSIPSKNSYFKNKLAKSKSSTILTKEFNSKRIDCDNYNVNDKIDINADDVSKLSNNLIYENNDENITEVTDFQNNNSNLTEILPGHIYFVATPIGNLNDISQRAINILSHCSIICAEDTRHTINLLRLLKISKKELLSHHEFNYKEQIPKIINLLKNGNSIAVVSDAGTPGISDPGAELARQCVINNIQIHPIPGPSAVVTALSVCGFDTSIFTFLGFLPVKGKERKEKLNQISSLRHTLIFYEAPHRILSTMSEINNLPFQKNRLCILCRELTKIHEEFIRGTVNECLEKIQESLNKSSRIRGEFTIILGPINDINVSDDEQVDIDNKIVEMLRNLKVDGIKRSEAVKIISDMIGNNSKSKVYKIALEIDWD